jgi:glycosyltransferase involved in cell wall biosynthesis
MPPSRSKPDISVVIPFFDAARHLAASVESVLAQSFRAWEALLVDDASTDAGPEIARAFARRFPGKIRVLRVPGSRNRGAFSARVLGARRAAAPLLALLDADDVWDPDYLERHLRFWRRCERSGAALSYGPARHWYPADPSGRKDYVQMVPAKRETVFAPGELLQNFLSGAFATVPKPSCCLVRRDALLEVAHFEREASKVPIVEDWFLSWGVGARRPIAVHTRPMVSYRKKFAPDAVPVKILRRLLREEAFVLPILKEHVRRWLPEHPLLGPEGIDARLSALRARKARPRLGDYFLRRIPPELLELSHGRSRRPAFL